MQFAKGLVKDEASSHYRYYLLIIGILVISFSLSFVLRIQPAEYGFELNEFDPFFNYRATQFVVENGLPAYLEWNDDLSWHPYGRDVSATSQVMLHTTGAMLYQTFGSGSTLYDFTIWFPVVISSLTTVIVFALVRTIGGTTAGLFASLFFAISPILIMRGSIGWFKSEPLGLFFGLLAVYLLISAIKSDKGKISLAKVVGGGILLAFGLASWGGVQFFIFPIGFFFLALPFLRKDNKYIIWTSVIFTSAFFLVSALFERTGIAYISNINGFFLVGCTAFLVASALVKKINNKTVFRNIGILLGGTITSGIVIAYSGLLNLPTFRYLNAANPFLIAEDMLTDSVSEHATSTLDISFFFFSILMVFAGIGAWLLFQKKVNRSLKIKGELAAFALIIGFLGVYFSSAFVRLEVFGAISVIILGSIGISILISKIQNEKHKPTSITVKTSFFAVILALLIVPLVYPIDINWSNQNTEVPNTLLNGGTHFQTATNDWPASMQWLKENTPDDAVIASWWDYGYWISTLSERKTLADNSTLLDWQIKKIALTFLSTPDDAWKILTADIKTDRSTNFVSFPLADSAAFDNTIKSYATNAEERKLEEFAEWQMADANGNGILNKDDGANWFPDFEKKIGCGKTGAVCPKYRDNPGTMDQYSSVFEYWKSEVYTLSPRLAGLDADYIVINLAAEKLPEENVVSLYTLRQKGGDETKVYWFAKIAGQSVFDYYNPGFKSYTDKFWNDTLLGKLIPFTTILYVDPANPELRSETFKKGYMPIYVKDIKLPFDEEGPFQLIYASPSYDRDDAGRIAGPLIYKINKDYNPNQ